MYDAEYYEELRPTTGLARLVDEARDALVARLVRSHSRGETLLDVGCGRGDLLARLEGTHQLHGVELSEAGLGLAKDRLPGATLAAGDIQAAVPLPGPFDVITAINVVEHLTNPGAAARNLAEVHSPGGLLVIHLPTIGNSWQHRRYMGSYDTDPTHVFRPSGREVIDLFQQSGYAHLRSAYSPFVPFSLWSHIPWQPAFLALFRRT